MKYMGGKSKIAKYILPIILDGRRKEQWYIEPFCGGLGTFDKVTGNRLACDNNKYLIAMWQGLQQNKERPIYITKELYSDARTEFNNKTNIKFSDFEIGWIGWMASFNGRFFDGGYSGTVGKRDYINEQIRNTEKQIPLIKGAVFESGDYRETSMFYPDNSIIYCDIPYKGTKQYATSKSFDYDSFYNWCRNMKHFGHRVFISEYDAPNDFTCVWEKEVTNSMNSTITYRPTERLYTI